MSKIIQETGTLDFSFCLTIILTIVLPKSTVSSVFNTVAEQQKDNQQA